MESCPYIYLISNLYRLKIAFPYRVPVFLKDKINLIIKTEHFAINLQMLIQFLLIKFSRRNVRFKARLYLLKSFKTYTRQFIHQQIFLVIFCGMSDKKQFVIIH